MAFLCDTDMVVYGLVTVAIIHLIDVIIMKCINEPVYLKLHENEVMSILEKI